MKNSTNAGYDQPYNVQVATTQGRLMIVAHSLSNHPNDQQEAAPTLNNLSLQVGKPSAAALDSGYFSEADLTACQTRGTDPYIASGREPHQQDWRTFFQELGQPPAEDASAKAIIAYRLRTEMGQAIYRLRKCTVEPVMGIIKDVLGFRQFLLRGLEAAVGEWCLVGLAFNLKRLHTFWPA